MLDPVFRGGSMISEKGFSCIKEVKGDSIACFNSFFLNIPMGMK